MSSPCGSVGNVGDVGAVGCITVVSPIVVIFGLPAGIGSFIGLHKVRVSDCVVSTVAVALPIDVWQPRV